MTELAKSDIFFFITSIAVGLVTLLMIIVLIYFFVILKKVKQIVDRVKQEGGEILDDLGEIREKLKENSGILKKVPVLFFLFKKLIKRKSNKHKK